MMSRKLQENGERLFRELACRELLYRLICCGQTCPATDEAVYYAK